MNDTDMEPSPAKVSAKNALCFAIIALVFTGVYPNEKLGNSWQGIIALVVLALGLMAVVFGIVALVRRREADGNSVLALSICGLVIGMLSNFSVLGWASRDWKQARLRVAARSQAPAVPAQSQTAKSQAARPAPPKSTVKYELPPLEAIPSMVQSIRVEARKLSGEDAGMLRAWAAHLERFHAAYTNTIAASNRLHSIDLLEPSLVSDLREDEGVRRRQLANQYADAWRQFENSVSTFYGSFYEDMHKERVSPDRSSVEAKALQAFLDERNVAQRLDILRNYCKAEQKVGLQYNYAASAVFDYARTWYRTPTVNPTARKHMDEMLGKLKEAEQAAAAARLEAAAELTPGGMGF